MTQPKLRFAQFTDDWECWKLGELTKRIRGNDGRMNLPTLTMSASSGWLNQIDRFSSNIAGNEQKNYTLLKKGQLSYNHGNSKLAKYGVVFELTSYDEALVPKVYHSFETNQKAVASFLEYMFATKLPDRELRKLVSSGARMDGLLNISYDDFMGIKITIPNVKEQTTIGNFFRQVDKLIALHQGKLDKVKTLKKGLLQKMFPAQGETVPQIRFPQFTDAWEQRKLGEVTKRVRGNDGRMNLPTLTMSASSGWLNQIDRFSSNIAGNEQKNYTLLKKGQLSYNHGNSKLAKYGVVFELTNHDEALVPKVYHSFETNKKAVANFLEYMFATKLPDRELRKLVSSGARMDGLLNISYDDFMGIKITIPDIKEQTTIGNFFRQFDDLINLHQRKLEHLKALKKSLLQQMFV